MDYSIQNVKTSPFFAYLKVRKKSCNKNQDLWRKGGELISIIREQNLNIYFILWECIAVNLQSCTVQLSSPVWNADPPLPLLFHFLIISASSFH